MTTTLATEPLRAEHRGLVPHLAELERTHTEIEAWDTDQAAKHLDASLEFLRGHLVPHARAEEEVLYPAVEQAMGAPGATETMRADHVEIVARIDRLADTTARVTSEWPDPGLVDDVTNQLAALRAIVWLHFRKEEDVLLPHLDRTLTSDDASALFARMGHVAHGS